MKSESTYADFVNKMLDEIDLLAAPKSSALLERLLAESSLTGQPPEVVRKHIASAIAKYDQMISRELSKPSHSKTWNDAIQELDERRSGRSAREEADRGLKIRKLLRDAAQNG